MHKDMEMIANMERYGGSFVRALAECLNRADNYNYDRLKKAFPDYFDQYRADKWRGVVHPEDRELGD